LLHVGLEAFREHENLVSAFLKVQIVQLQHQEVKVVHHEDTLVFGLHKVLLRHTFQQFLDFI
jgi:hypothetical protein